MDATKSGFAAANSSAIQPPSEFPIKCTGGKSSWLIKSAIALAIDAGSISISGSSGFPPCPGRSSNKIEP